MSAITAKASRKMKKYAVLTREPRCFLGSFDFSWEQRKFEEIAVRSSVICSDDTLPRVEYEDIVSGTGRLNKDIYAKQSIKSGIAFHQGDVLYGKLRPYLQNWLLPTFDGLAVGDFWVLQPQNADSSFLYRLIQSRQFDEVANQSTGTKMPRADWKLVSKTVFSIPSNISEQAAIGTYFTALDSLITLHQRKCANLCSPSQVVFSLLFATSTFSWEQRKVSDLAEKTYGGGTPTTSNEAYWNGDIPWIQSSDVVDGKLLGVEPRKWITQDGLNNSAAQLIPGNSIAIITRVGVGKLAFMPYSYATSQDFLSLSKLNAEPLFTVYACYKKLQSELNAVQGTSIKGITKDELLAKNIMVPRYAEQQQIGAFFKQLDHLITLHQRECISFTGRADRLILTANKKRTTSSWEQRKFGEITSKYEDPVPTPHDGYYRLGIRSHAKGTFHSYVAKGQELETAQMHRVAAGNFIVNITFGWEHAVAITDKNDAGKLVSHRFPQFSFAEGMVPEFFRYVIVDEKFRHHLWLASPGGAGRNRVLKLDEMLNYLMRFPSRDEQIKIAEFFRHLDNLITLHQRKPFLMKWRTSDANRNQTNRLVL